MGMLIRAAIVWTAFGLVACGDGDEGGKPAGTEGGACYPNSTCNKPFVCLSNLCVRLPEGGLGDGGSGTGGADGSGGSSGSGGTDASGGSSGSGGTDASGGSSGSGGVAASGGVDGRDAAAHDASSDASVHDGSVTEGGSADACVPLSSDPSAFNIDCSSSACPAGYTCKDVFGIIYMQRCQILCEKDCECPGDQLCTSTSDESGSTWSHCAPP